MARRGGRWDGARVLHWLVPSRPSALFVTPWQTAGGVRQDPRAQGARLPAGAPCEGSSQLARASQGLRWHPCTGQVAADTWQLPCGVVGALPWRPGPQPGRAGARGYPWYFGQIASLEAVLALLQPHKGRCGVQQYLPSGQFALEDSAVRPRVGCAAPGRMAHSTRCQGHLLARVGRTRKPRRRRQTWGPAWEAPGVTAANGPPAMRRNAAVNTSTTAPNSQATSSPPRDPFKSLPVSPRPRPKLGDAIASAREAVRVICEYFRPSAAA